MTSLILDEGKTGQEVEGGAMGFDMDRGPTGFQRRISGRIDDLAEVNASESMGQTLLSENRRRKALKCPKGGNKERS
jgi:hypothetical protein